MEHSLSTGLHKFTTAFPPHPALSPARGEGIGEGAFDQLAA
jgi:hypothetical protein